MNIHIEDSLFVAHVWPLNPELRYDLLLCVMGMTDLWDGAGMDYCVQDIMVPRIYDCQQLGMTSIVWE